MYISHDIPIYPIRSHISPLNSGYVQHVAPESGATARFLGQMSETTSPWRSTAIISLGDIHQQKMLYVWICMYAIIYDICIYYMMYWEVMGYIKQIHTNPISARCFTCPSQKSALNLGLMLARLRPSTIDDRPAHRLSQTKAYKGNVRKPSWGNWAIMVGTILGYWWSLRDIDHQRYETVRFSAW